MGKTSFTHTKTNIAILIGVVIFIMVLILGLQQVLYVDKAHQTFENYYAFRGCNQLVKRTPTYGLCRVSSGQIIKLVKYNGLWYLDGDLPTCIARVCL